MDNDHFLDTNVLIGSLIDWDPLNNDSERYMSLENGYMRHTSCRVLHEATKKLSCIRSIIEDFMEELESRPRSYGKSVDIHIFDIVIHIKKKWHLTDDSGEWRSFTNFLNKKYPKIRDAVMCSEVEVIALADTTNKSMRGAIDSLRSECTTTNKSPIYLFDDCPDSYIGNPEYKQLSKVVHNRADTRILMDSYHIKTAHIPNNVRFVTFDKKDIINNQQEIEAILNGVSILCPKCL